MQDSAGHCAKSQLLPTDADSVAEAGVMGAAVLASTGDDSMHLVREQHLESRGCKVLLLEVWAGME